MAHICIEWIKLNIWVYGWILNFLFGYIIRKVHFGTSVLYRSKNVFSFNVKKNLFYNLYYHSLTIFGLLLQPIECSYDTHHCIMYDKLKWFPLNIMIY